MPLNYVDGVTNTDFEPQTFPLSHDGRSRMGSVRALGAAETHGSVCLRGTLQHGRIVLFACIVCMAHTHTRVRTHTHTRVSSGASKR